MTRDGKHLSLWFFDPYARPGKHAPATFLDELLYLQAFRRQISTIVSNNANFVKGKPGDRC
ncbi:MAG: hypothetical protein R3E75_04980 [Steroidobacteraceae bacterium]